MTPLGWSGWDQDSVMLSTVRLTWCMMDTVEGAKSLSELFTREDAGSQAPSRALATLQEPPAGDL
ncbi:hypothetical protein EYF80_065486 [Liparis tanakae]|uniref:Uncharacterized protein n=1 Tax=Liparis tanakae TaxID=230148 RepID=A0A4Z2E6K4_9TELE|nr:hypothetical protein EYF80_065486 [Liparis tanakae]